LSKFALDFDKAALTTDDSMHHGQAHAGSTGFFLCGKIRFKNSVEELFLNAATGIGDTQLKPFLAVAGLRGEIEGNPQDPVAAGHGMGSIGTEIDQHLMNLHGINKYPAATLIDLFLDDDSRRQGGAHKLHHLFNDGMNILQHLLFLDASRKSQYLFHQGFGPFGRLENFLQIIEYGLIGETVLLHFQADNFRIPHDGGENVVKIVGNAAGQGTDGLHFLGMAQLSFEPELLGDVLGYADNSSDTTLFVDDRRSGYIKNQLVAIHAENTCFLNT